MATATSKSYTVGDSVFVIYPQTDSNYWAAVSRTVATMDVNATGNTATVKFTSGNQIVDSDASSTVYTTEVAANIARVNEIITNSAAAVASDTTTSIVSTAGNTSTTLGRIG